MVEGKKRSKEEEYFHKKEKELIEKMRERSAIESERGALAKAIGVADENILADLRTLGYTRETVALLHLVPLVEMAWAEGGVDQRERELIYEAARLRGIESGSAAYQLLNDWLTRRPSAEFFQKTLRVIGAMIKSLPKDEQQESKRDLVAYCTRIAAASGGILGLGNKTSPAERKLLEKIAGELEGRG